MCVLRLLFRFANESPVYAPQRHFVTFGIGFPGPTSLHTIYNTFLNGHLQHFNEEIQGLSSGIVNGALSIHNEIAKTFRKSAINFHYEFSIRHMSNVFSGILMAQPERFVEVRGLLIPARL